MRAKTLIKSSILYTDTTVEDIIVSIMSQYPAAAYATLNSAILLSACTRLICLNPLSFIIYGGLSGSENGLDSVFHNSDIRHLVGRAMRAKEYWVLHANDVHQTLEWDTVNRTTVPETLRGTPIARRTTGFMYSKVNAEMLYQVIAKCGETLAELQVRPLKSRLIFESHKSRTS